MKRIFQSTIIILCFLSVNVRAQSTYNPMWDSSSVNSIYITISPDSLAAIYANVTSNHQYPAQFVYDNGITEDTLQNIGFRLRGNTSRYSAKKSFKINFSHFVNGRTYDGEEELNLNGSHNDPTMVREKLFYDLWNGMGMPARKTAFVNLYINGNYYGLYTNLEEYDEIFLQNRFGNSSGNLYKCTYPASLDYLGTDQQSYKNIVSSAATGGRAYELETNTDADDYSDFVHLVTVINETAIDDLPCELEKIFDVDSYLRAYALDVSSGNWDDYSFNQNNYYLYHNPATGKFIFLAYDCDNTFGVDFVGVDWGTRNIYSWFDSSYPLTARIMQVPEYKDRFSYYLNQLLNDVLLPAKMDPHIDSMKTLIAPFALLDSFRTLDYGYTYADFLNGFNTNNIDSHTPYGVENFVGTRDTNSLSQLTLNNIAPIVNNQSFYPPFPIVGQNINVTATAIDDQSVQSVNLIYSIDSLNYDTLVMYDDGMHHDGNPGDNIYGASIPITKAGMIEYYFSAEDNSGNLTRYPACDFFTTEAKAAGASGIVINEFMAENDSTIIDNDGKYADWIELFNPTNDSVNLNNYFLTDNLTEPGKFQMPDTILAPDNYILFWADDESDEGGTHTDFKLSKSGEQVGIYASSDSGMYQPIDTLTFGPQGADTSFGRCPDGTGAFAFMIHATPGYENDCTTLVNIIQQNDTKITLLGNPAYSSAQLSVTLQRYSNVKVELYSIEGKRLNIITANNYSEGTHLIPINCLSLSAGTYFLKVIINNEVKALKLIVI
jgi:spore coat protein CotH